ncbi:adenosylmethionine--8-amino-7-oxononanoate transaminase, partial [Dissulfurirhabdus thermomarina]
MNLMDVDRRCLWHPYTQMKDFEREDLLFVDRAEGIVLHGRDGRRYYDTISSWWCILHGHRHPRIIAAVKAQLDRLDQVHLAGTTHEGAIRLAERLVALTPPGLTRVFYSDDGSTACEVALKMSLHYWHLCGERRRTRFVGFERGYHGDTIGTMSLGGTPNFHGPYAPLMMPAFRVPAPYCYRCALGKTRETCAVDCLAPLEALLEERGDEIAGIILEPMLQGAGGMIVHPAAFVRGVAEAARRHGVHLILDEVATGFGRTGRLFALEHAGVCPDFLCLSKGLTAGMLPMAATLTTEEVFSAFYDDYEKGTTFFHGHTFTGNPLAAAAALASLELFDEGALDAARPRMRQLQEGARRFEALPHVGEVRGIGMVAAVELVADKARKTPFPPERRTGWQAYKAGLREGLILRPLGDVVYLFLPLSVTEAELEDILERTGRVLARVGRE